MTPDYLDIAITPSVRAAQAAKGMADLWASRDRRSSDRFGAAEAQFIQARNSFYLASVSETGWPYVQHRGGPQGFLKVLDDRRLAFADFRGNRQYITVGNLAASDKVSLFLMDYPNRRRLKIYGHMRALETVAEPELAKAVTEDGYKGRAERVLEITLAGFDWNCPQHITPRFTAAELAEAIEPQLSRLTELEAENRALRARLAAEGLTP
jgi:hypothetical protein